MYPEVIVVDDDLVANKVLAYSFLRTGYKKIECFNDGKQFLKYLLSTDTVPPKVIILDYNMPEFNGFQLLAYLKRNSSFSDVQVIIYSAILDEAVKRTCLKAGAVDYVEKKESVREMEAFCRQVISLAKVES